MGATSRVFVAAAVAVALVLATARGFVVPVPAPAFVSSPALSWTSAVARPSSIPESRIRGACSFACGDRPFRQQYSRSCFSFSSSPSAVGDASARCFRRTRSSNSLNMRLGSRLLMPGGGRKLAFVAMANAAAFSTVGGGVLAGGLHAVSGPDHLAALLPRIMGQKWHNSMRIGATWGLGHGFSATVIGLAAFFFKDRLGLGHNDKLVAVMGTWTEGLVGVSLIAIGLLGLKESFLDYEETPVFETQSAGSAVVEGSGGRGTALVGNKGGGKAIFLNGVLHGFSWDGAPSLAPALALSSWGSVLWFLLAYCSGTMMAMSATTTLIGEGSLRVGKALDQPDIPRKLSIVSSFVALVIGAVWLAKAVFF